MSGLLMVILLAAAIGSGAYLLQRRRARLSKKSAELRDHLAGDLVGLAGMVVSAGFAGGRGRVRLTDRNGTLRELEARVEDVDLGPLHQGAEVLVITNPSEFQAMVVVPNDLPSLEGPA